MVDYKRRQWGREFICPLCSPPASFQQEPKLWEHAKYDHMDFLESKLKGDESQKRKHFSEEAKVNKLMRQKILPEPPGAGSKPSSNDSMLLNVGDDENAASRPDRPVSAPGLASPSEKDIGGLEKLSLSQPLGHPAPLPPLNPRKRASAIDEALSDAELKKRDGAIHNRRAKDRPGGPSSNWDPEYDRKFVLFTAPHVSRTPQTGSNRRLYNPVSDSPTANMGPHGSGKHDNAVANRVYDPRTHTFRSKKAPEDTDQSLTTTHLGQHDPLYIEKVPPRRLSPNVKPKPQEIPMELLIGAAMTDSPTDPTPEMLVQPETRPISHAQLAVEVKGIYAGLLMVETKCVDVDEKQSIAAQEKDPARQTKLSNEQWQALIALHRTLLHEHHDFFLASQHPSAGPALTRLAAQYSMPARMWRHGIHSFLEVLRHRLPDSLDHMLAFIYIAYSMMALLYETVTAFEDTWIECLGDLGRYRMAIEDVDRHDREVWSGVARFWYSKAADRNPRIGRLYHHLAILARPGSFEQLSFYTRSLTCTQPFNTARSSIMTVFKPALLGDNSALSRSVQVEVVFIKAHANLFTGNLSSEYDALVDQLASGILDHYIGKITSKFKAQGVFAAVINIAALFEYGALKANGSTRSIFRLAFDEFEVSRNSIESFNTATTNEKQFAIDNGGHRSSVVSPPSALTPNEVRDSEETIARGSRIMFVTLSVALRRIGDKNVYPLVHVCFVFLWRLLIVGKPVHYVEKDVPWGEVSSFLNTLAKSVDIASTIEAEEFPWPAEGLGRPLPEEYIIRGQVWSQRHFPEKYFEDAKVDDEERPMEVPSMAPLRVERILWLGFRLASLGRWIHYDRETKTFSTMQYVADLHAERSPSATGTPLSDIKGGDMIMSGGVEMDGSNPHQSKVLPYENDADMDSTMMIRPPPPAFQKLGGIGQDTPMLDAYKGRTDISDQHQHHNPVTVAWLDGNHGTAQLSPQKTPTTESPFISGDVAQNDIRRFSNNKA
ncbi:DNA/RNA-binding domain, Est1-type [Lasallia pustulata]|uniref:Nonsense-mediated mRNA decay factor n=1 Tax=Lasallia pustulata TaxID=136370 RepID=A0A1W5D9P3_9LECA|nr:DNA/RNA-binding domain, Est1-type [Lasallia pustulata]